MMLSCIAAVAIATVVGKKTFESHAYETSNLLMQNVEALATESEGIIPHVRCVGTKYTCAIITEPSYLVIDGEMTK